MSVDIKITKSFDDFSLDFKLNTDSKRIGILGASGCGKSMLLKSLSGIIKPDTGFINIDGKVLFDSDSRLNVKTQNRHVGYLFQNYALFPTMSVFENIASGSRLKDDAKEKLVIEMMEMFKLYSLRNHLPSQLSGGQQQRVALARMMASQPEVLLFDEPFSAMDSHLREGLRLELGHLLEAFSGTTIIVTHDRDEAYQLCDELVLMNKGRVIQSGPTKSVFAHPDTLSAARLTGVKNISRVEYVDEHHVRAVNWEDKLIEVGESISEDIKYIGIRAHDLIESQTYTEQNIFSLEGASITELPFEYYVTLKNGLWWKKDKKELPRFLYAPSKSIIPLRED